MRWVARLVRSLGGAGAVANARTALDRRARDDWVVSGLVARLDAHEVAATTPAPRRAAAG